MCTVRPYSEVKKIVEITTKDGVHYRTKAYEDRGIGQEGDFKTPIANEMYMALQDRIGIEEDDIAYWSVVFDTFDTDTVYVSDHAYTRLKERNGWNKKTSDRMVKKIYESKKTVNDLKGYRYQWGKRRAKKAEGSHIKTYVYGDKTYLFHGNTLITVIQIPNKEAAMRLVHGMAGDFQIVD